MGETEPHFEQTSDPGHSGSARADHEAGLKISRRGSHGRDLSQGGIGKWNTVFCASRWGNAGACRRLRRRLDEPDWNMPCRAHRCSIGRSAENTRFPNLDSAGTLFHGRGAGEGRCTGIRRARCRPQHGPWISARILAAASRSGSALDFARYVRFVVPPRGSFKQIYPSNAARRDRRSSGRRRSHRGGADRRAD